MLENFIWPVLVIVVSAAILAGVRIAYKKVKANAKAKLISLKLLSIFGHSLPYASLSLVVFLWFYTMNRWRNAPYYFVEYPVYAFSQRLDFDRWNEAYASSLNIGFFMDDVLDIVTHTLAALILILSIYCLVKTINLIRSKLKKNNVAETKDVYNISKMKVRDAVTGNILVSSNELVKNSWKQNPNRYDVAE